MWLHTQAVLQGAFILAKAKGGAEIAAASIHHLHRYIELLFEPAKRRGKEISWAQTLGSKTNSRMTAWNALPEAQRLAKQKEGIAAWKAWAEKH
jgi:hypothetical protein